MKYLIRILVIVIALLPFFVYSAGLPKLIPCDPCPEGAKNCGASNASNTCDFVALITMANNIIKFCIVLGTSVFAIVFM
ncbi:MAG: hypothetical protein WCJ74_01665, partial [bacterium]